MDTSLFFTDDQSPTARHFNAHILQYAEEAYSQPGRYYHNFDHIKEMILVGKKTFGLTFQQYLAIIFHDIVYNPRASKNEEMSVDCLFNVIKTYRGQLSHEDIRFYGEVATIIMDTKKHYYPTTDLSKVVLDLDLERLSRPLEEVKYFTNLIRQEYSFVDDKTFNDGRKEFYLQFLNTEPAFSTEYGRKLWEPKAKENINQLLNLM